MTTTTRGNNQLDSEEPSHPIKIGDIVISYDFPHTDTCFVEGEVVGLGVHGRIDIRVDRRIWEDKEVVDHLVGQVVRPHAFSAFTERRMVFRKDEI